MCQRRAALIIRLLLKARQILFLWILHVLNVRIIAYVVLGKCPADRCLRPEKLGSALKILARPRAVMDFLPTLRLSSGFTAAPWLLEKTQAWRSPIPSFVCMCVCERSCWIHMVTGSAPLHLAVGGGRSQWSLGLPDSGEVDTRSSSPIPLLCT